MVIKEKFKIELVSSLPRTINSICIDTRYKIMRIIDADVLMVTHQNRCEAPLPNLVNTTQLDASTRRVDN